MGSDQHLSDLLTNPKAFSISTYLNQALEFETSKTTSSSTSSSQTFDDEDLQRRMAELALQLQVQTQSCHDEIGRIGAELRAILPRCAGDLGRLNVGLDGMKEDASTLLDEHLKSSLGYVDSESNESAVGGGNGSEANGDDDGVAENNEKENGVGETNDNVENEENIPPTENSNNSSSNNNTETSTMSPLETLETLSTLHALQQNLTATKSILHSVSTYDKTIKSLPSLLTSSSNLNHAVNALITLEEGARALSGMPGQNQRNEEISSTRKKILTLLKPELLHALKKMESRLGPLQTCVGMYNSLGKIESLMEEYVKNRPSSVHGLWFEYGKTTKRGSAGGSGSGNTTTGGGTSGNNTRSNELEFYGDGLDDEDLFGEDEENNDTEKDNMEVVTRSNITPFGEWLPTWYEAVLLLLSEEQRRALTVFGPELAPEIMAKILHECFRPIISSFKARLSAIFPAHAKEGTQISTSGSFEQICAAYESTLQFLSIAYENLVDFNSSNKSSTNGGDSDTKNSSATPSRTKSAVELYQMIRTTFISVGSPFAPYQMNFSELEANHSGMTSRFASRDIHGAVTLSKADSAGALLQSMQHSVEKLTHLAPCVFPLAQAAMARFESLNSGYGATKALSTVDTLVSRHTGEISIAIHTLSTNMLSHSDKLTDNFDEQQVQYALEVLKIAGLIRRDLTSFEEKTRDRLRILMGRMSAAIDEECNVKSVAAANSSNQAWSQVPDSLSAAEIEAIFAMNVCAEAGDDEGSSKSPSILVLQRLATPDKLGKKAILFPEAMNSIARLVKSCQSFVFDICAALPMKHLDGMSSLAVWKQEESMWSSSAPDSYGTLPQSHITQVGEHMLALVQALEPFASDKDALSLANLVMEGVERVAFEPWKAFIDAIDCDDVSNEEFINALMKGQAIKDLVINHESMQNIDDEEDMEDEEDSETHAFCNKWLDAVCTAVTGRLLDRTMRIHRLSKKGGDHLTVDFNYIVNVFSALGVSGHPHPLLSHIADITSMESAALENRISMSNTDDLSPLAKAVHNTEVRIALMKGVSL